jgi:hypothetical protein
MDFAAGTGSFFNKLICCAKILALNKGSAEYSSLYGGEAEKTAVKDCLGTFCLFWLGRKELPIFLKVPNKYCLWKIRHAFKISALFSALI